jgi:deoxyribodipyrimidine photo-lyase
MQHDAEGFGLAGDARIRPVNDRPVREDGDFVLYWMIAARRPAFNFALDRAVAWSLRLQKPLVVLEPLEVDYPWASDRLHAFVMQGMAENRRTFGATPALYYPYVEPRSGTAKGLLAAFGRAAALVVTDEYPCFFLPRVVAAAGRQLPIRLEAVDGNGLLPLSLADRTYTAAVHFRRHVQKHLVSQLSVWPSPKPFHGRRLPQADPLDRSLVSRWPSASDDLLQCNARALAALPIDHEVHPVRLRGGHLTATRALGSFVRDRLGEYHLAHNHPDDEGTSRLSPYLHFGHIAAHQIFDAVMRHERWSARRITTAAAGKREGWWGVGPGADAFLDQLVVWRGLAFNTTHRRPDDYAEVTSLPAWALATLEAHRRDPRPYVYSREVLERGESHDVLWNAAQQELRQRGWFHNYMRMLWGKKILEWSRTPREALTTMMAIMDRWSLDGRDPNSYAGYTWCLGRYDRPWPERPIFGTVRSMSSARTADKVRVARYLRHFGGASDGRGGAPRGDRASTAAAVQAPQRGRRGKRKSPRG